MSTIFELIDSGDVERIRAKLADDPAAAAAHDELGLTVVMRAAYRVPDDSPPGDAFFVCGGWGAHRIDLAE